MSENKLINNTAQVPQITQQAQQTPQTQTIGVFNSVKDFMTKHKLMIAGVIILAIVGFFLYKRYYCPKKKIIKKMICNGKRVPMVRQKIVNEQDDEQDEEQVEEQNEEQNEGQDEEQVEEQDEKQADQEQYDQDQDDQ